MNMAGTYQECFEKWLAGIDSEIAFWIGYINGKGAGGSHKWEDVISSDRPFRLEEELDAPETSFLDVGSGPFSRCGLKTDKTRLHFTAVDPLAHVYRRIKRIYGISTGVTPDFAMVEYLHERFPESAFDIVHMSNSLDHCFDPLAAIFNMLYVCGVGGKIILRHTKNEATRSSYDGFHQWNLVVESGRFIIWRPGTRLDVGQALGALAEVSARENVLEQPEKVWKYDQVTIVKKKKSPVPKTPYNFLTKEKLMQALCENLLAAHREKKDHRENDGNEAARGNLENTLLKKKLYALSQAYERLEHELNKRSRPGGGGGESRCNAARHAIEWNRLYGLYPGLPHIGGIELSNICNLQCPNCPTPTTAYPRGYATEETVLAAFKLAQPGAPFSFHRFGEPFLHPDFLKYLSIGGQLGLRTVVSTNGTLLNAENIKEMMAGYPHVVMVSLHSRKSLGAFIQLTEYCYSHDCFPIQYQANLLSHNADEVEGWLRDAGADETVRRFIAPIKSHSWAGNVASRRKDYSKTHVRTMVERCHFIRNNIVNIRWDGSVVACCLDSENAAELGHVSDFRAIRHNPDGYSLCEHCDSNWMHGDG